VATAGSRRTEKDLAERARKLGIRGASQLNKKELARAIARKQK
jgi:hypothetical protein